MDDNFWRYMGYIWCLAMAFAIGGLVGSCAAPKATVAAEPAPDRTCFPKGVLVKSETVGVVCIDARAIRWDETP